MEMYDPEKTMQILSIVLTIPFLIQLLVFYFLRVLKAGKHDDNNR
jgi:hypothetical protein